MKTLLRFKRVKVLLLLLMLSASAMAQTTATVTVLGGEQSIGGVWDNGDLTITINNTLSRTVSYGQFSTPESVASGLAAVIARECYGVASAKADGAKITFHLRYASAAPISITSGTSHWDTGHFAGPSFSFGSQQTVNPTNLTLVGSTGELIPPNTPVGLTAHIAQNAATGSIEFYDRGRLLGTSGISGAQASFTTPLLEAGAHELYAKYTGDGSYASSTSNTVYATAANHSGPAVNTSVYRYTITTDGSDSSDGTISGYAVNGNVLAYYDSIMGKWSLGYDSLNRLSSGVIQSGALLSQVQPYFCWSYDSFGNRWSQVNSSQSFSVSSGSSCQSGGTLTQTLTNYDGNNRITSTNAPNYTAYPLYDNGGNMTNDGRNVYLYDAEGRVCAVQAPPVISGMPIVMQQYIYDAEGRRVAKGTISSWSCNTDTNGFVQTVAYVDGPDDQQMTEMSVAVNGAMSWVHTNVTAGGKLVATYQNDNGGTTPETGNLHFALLDWLGTKRLQTSHDGTYDNSWRSLPFGDVPPSPPGGSYSTPDATEQHFTGKERDTESGLDYFGARYYSSSMGRFMSPDWSIKISPIPYGRLGDPQSLNLYAYVRNNPLSMVDRDGHNWFKDFANGLADSTYRPLVQAASHPIATAQAVGSAVAHPIATGQAIGTAVKNTVVAAAHGDGRAIGQIVGTAVSAVATGGAIKGVSAGIQAIRGASVAGAIGEGIVTTEQTVTLFRAVDATELQSIRSTGSFLPSPNGTEYKGFFFSQQSAEQFGAQQAAMGGPETSVVSGTAPADLVNSSPAHSAATEGPGVLIHNDNLPQVTPHE